MASYCFSEGAGRRCRWEGRPSLSHKPIKNSTCLSDSMLQWPRERPANEKFASGVCPTRSRAYLIVKVAAFNENAKGCYMVRAHLLPSSVLSYS